MRAIASSKIIETCGTMFCLWGIPTSVRTDNGPQFGTEFQAFLRENGIFWMSTTPVWPQANGEVERQNRLLPTRPSDIRHVQPVYIQLATKPVMAHYNTTGPVPEIPD